MLQPPKKILEILLHVSLFLLLKLNVTGFEFFLKKYVTVFFFCTQLLRSPDDLPEKNPIDKKQVSSVLTNSDIIHVVVLLLFGDILYHHNIFYLRK